MRPQVESTSMYMDFAPIGRGVDRLDSDHVERADFQVRDSRHRAGSVAVSDARNGWQRHDGGQCSTAGVEGRTELALRQEKPKRPLRDVIQQNDVVL